jgi:hypothetical protein
VAGPLEPVHERDHAGCGRRGSTLSRRAQEQIPSLGEQVYELEVLEVGGESGGELSPVLGLA